MAARNRGRGGYNRRQGWVPYQTWRRIFGLGWKRGERAGRVKAGRNQAQAFVRRGGGRKVKPYQGQADSAAVTKAFRIVDTNDSWLDLSTDKAHQKLKGMGFSDRVARYVAERI